MSNRPSLLFLATFALCAGCAPMRYSQYTGRQTWPTGTATMADKGYAIPVYRGWPEKAYRVIGSIQFSNPNDYWDDGDTARAARLAKSNKGEAIIMRRGSEAGVDGIAGAAADPHLLANVGQVSVLVINWRPEAELEQERAELESFEASFRSRHPELTLRREVLEVGYAFVGFKEHTLGTAEGRAKLEEVLLRVLQTPRDNKSSTWLFKGTLRSSGVASSYTQTACGMATLTQTGNSVTLISEPGSITEVNFSGFVRDGHLSGQLGITSGTTLFTGKAEGVLVPERISLNGQAQTPDGLAQHSLTFTR